MISVCFLKILQSRDFEPTIGKPFRDSLYASHFCVSVDSGMHHLSLTCEPPFGPSALSLKVRTYASKWARSALSWSAFNEQRPACHALFLVTSARLLENVANERPMAKQAEGAQQSAQQPTTKLRVKVFDSLS